jgi:hypothetical protein
MARQAAALNDWCKHDCMAFKLQPFLHRLQQTAAFYLHWCSALVQRLNLPSGQQSFGSEALWP